MQKNDETFVMSMVTQTSPLFKFLKCHIARGRLMSRKDNVFAQENILLLINLY